MKRFRNLLLIALFLTHASYAKPPIRVYIMAGQSNMSGTNNPLVIQLPASLVSTVPNVLIKVNSYSVNCNWGSLRPGLGATTANFGPEITFGLDELNTLQKLDTTLFGSKIAIIKYAYGGTTLDVDWRPPSSGGIVGWLYKGIINDINASLATLDSTYDAQIMGMCWMQGEYDALVDTEAINYQTNLSNFIQDIRTDLNLLTMPFCIGMIDSSPHWPYNAIVRQAETNVAKSTAGVSVFDTHGLGTDGTHYNTQGQIELGHLFFRYLDDAYTTCTICNGNNTVIFPNPSIGSFSVLYSGIPSNYQYTITDMKGAEVLQGQLYIGYEVDISSLSAGIYFISLTTIEGTIVKKVVKI